jgi:glycosyltransferase involved in cell wall biosynthesis
MADVSVAMGTYNGARFLPEQLNSLEKQTRRPRELVVCDDGSTDATIAIIEDFSKRASFEVRLFINPRNLGWVENFLQCAARCKCDLIAFCDQDDVWAPEKLEKCAAAFADGVLLVMHESDLVDGSLTPLGAQCPNLRRYGRHGPLRTDPMLFGCGMALVVRKILVEHFGASAKPTNPYRTGVMPHDQWMQFLARILGDVVYLPDRLAVWRQHGSNTVGAPQIDSGWRQLAQIRNTAADSYRGVGGILREWAECLSALSEYPNLRHDWALRLLRGVDFYKRLAVRYERRAVIYEPGGGIHRRIGALASLAANGGYFGRDRGGLGARSLAKDSMFTILDGVAR